SALPPGVLIIEVVDADGRPLANHPVWLASLREGIRDRQSLQTDNEGRIRRDGLATGIATSYRVTVPYQGAQYMSPPFQLDDEQGTRVRVEVRPTTTSNRSLLLVLGQTLLELRDERLHVIQELRLTNLGKETHLFPQEGLFIPLPPNTIAFQAKASMNDIRIVEEKGKGIRLFGSLPTGQENLNWAFDLPLHGQSLRFELGNPFRTFRYRVVASAPPSATLEVEGFPSARRLQNLEQNLLVTEIQRMPKDPPLRTIRIALSGIPGPGAGRFYALLCAAALALGGILLPLSSASASLKKRFLEQQKQALLERIFSIEESFVRGEIGPQTREKLWDESIEELALILYEEHQHHMPS
ncbi:MAG: carboxypeptidase-like regulatory domain-containing protein, partial [Deltaproteobacteria bacterium]|nr:carboxypeptidase-like regulatory domain-containing protein [Deltaproteobacteria bacterium]